MDGWTQIDINRKVERDLEYIKNDIICKQLNDERYIKFCKPLNMIGVIDMTREQYEKYWNTQYLHYPSKRKIIFEAIAEKFKTGLTTTKEMIKIIQNSKDLDQEKSKAIKLLKGE